MTKEQDTTSNVIAKDANKRSVQREEHPIEALPDQDGVVTDIDKSRYPEGSPARKGTATPPSGQGGLTPKKRPDYQDQWPANPEPDEETKAWAKKVAEVGPVAAHSEAAGRVSKAPKEK